MQVDDQCENRDCRKEIHDIWQSVAVESLLQSTGFIVSRKEKVEESDEGTFELRSATGVDGRGRECLPDDRLADVGSDEERDTRAESVALLEQLIEQDD